MNFISKQWVLFRIQNTTRRENKGNIIEFWSL